MIELERHIEILLLSNDCVIVPDLGGFMAHHVDARYDEQDGVFLPPTRTLGFNPKLRLNDSLLVQSYIEAYDISYPEALRRIESEVEELRGHLETEGSYELNDIGVLRLNSEGKLEFEPCEAGILTPELYGLSSFEMKPLVQDDANGQDDAQDVPEESAITIKMSWLRNVAAVAAAVIGFLMIETPVQNSRSLPTPVQQSSFINVPVTQRALPGDSMLSVAALEKELLTQQSETAIPEATDSEQASDASFCIVMASQVSERNANTFIGQLEHKGFADAHILVSGPKRIRRVVYGSYETETDAANTLRQLRSESKLFSDSWIMKVEN